MKNIYIIGVLLFALFASVGQASAQEMETLDARAILDKVVEKLDYQQGTAVNFRICSPSSTSERQEGPYTETKGSFVLKNDKFYILTEGMQTWFDGHTQWSYSNWTEEVTISNPTPEELQSINPLAWLSLYKKGYKLEIVDRKSSSVKILMTDTTGKAEFTKFRFGITRNYLIASIEWWNRAGDTADIMVVPVEKVRTIYPDSFFRFNPKEYPNAEVIDLR